METTVVKINENYGSKCLKDSNKKIHSERKPLGYVEIYEKDEKTGEEKFLGKHNLVVWQGREWVCSKIFDVNNVLISPILASDYISWFGLGESGADPGDPLDPLTVTDDRTELFSPIAISTTDSSCGDLQAGSYYKHYFDSLEFISDSNEGGSYVIAKIEITIGTDDANGSGTQNINEAGLYVSASTAGGYSGNFHLFCMVTFPTLVKDINRQLKFLWYIYT